MLKVGEKSSLKPFVMCGRYVINKPVTKTRDGINEKIILISNQKEK